MDRYVAPVNPESIRSVQAPVVIVRNQNSALPLRLDAWHGLCEATGAGPFCRTNAARVSG
jgi:hypothetical protein